MNQHDINSALFVMVAPPLSVDNGATFGLEDDGLVTHCKIVHCSNLITNLSEPYVILVCLDVSKSRLTIDNVLKTKLKHSSLNSCSVRVCALVHGKQCHVSLRITGKITLVT